MTKCHVGLANGHTFAICPVNIASRQVGMTLVDMDQLRDHCHFGFADTDVLPKSSQNPSARLSSVFWNMIAGTTGSGAVFSGLKKPFGLGWAFLANDFIT